MLFSSGFDWLLLCGLSLFVIGVLTRRARGESRQTREERESCE